MSVIHKTITSDLTDIYLSDKADKNLIKLPSHTSKVFILCDDNTYKLCLPLFNIDADIIVINHSDENKTLTQCETIWTKLTEANADKNAVLINLGGGMVSDIGGFAASTYKRGIRYINIPTTLLAMVDASVGGKTAINFRNYKNIIGTITQPHAVYVFTELLHTLPEREYIAGFAEMIKHGLIADENHLNELKSLKNVYKNITLEMIEHSISIKNNIVTQDPHEKGMRKILNFGHTIGHAIESVSIKNGYHLLHGEAIAAGIISELFLSNINNNFRANYFAEAISLITHNFPKINWIKGNEDLIIDLAIQDKKNSDNKYLFSLLNKIGEAEFDIECNKVEIKAALAFYNSCY